jgi:LmbE family N-acetylglucosaminyl deacetylase
MRALLFAPHSDDEALFASFLCLRYRPLVVICFRSEQQDDFGVPAGVREAETERAMSILGCAWRQWPLGDRYASDDEVEAFMWGLRDPAGEDDWDAIFAPAFEPNGNVQHNLIASLADTVFADVQVEHYLTYTNPPLVRSTDGTEIEYEPAWLFQKHAALACYGSQARTPSYRHFAENMKEYLA